MSAENCTPDAESIYDHARKLLWCCKFSRDSEAKRKLINQLNKLNGAAKEQIVSGEKTDIFFVYFV